MILKQTNSLSLLINLDHIRARVINSIMKHYPELGVFGSFRAKEIMKILGLDKNKQYWMSTLRGFCQPTERAYGRSGKNKFDLYGLYRLALAQELQLLGFEPSKFDGIMKDVDFDKQEN